MYPEMYWLLAAYVVIFVSILIVCAKFTSRLIKGISAVAFVGAIVIIATNDEVPANSSRIWYSVLLFLAAILTNLFAMTAKKDQQL